MSPPHLTKLRKAKEKPKVTIIIGIISNIGTSCSYYLYFYFLTLFFFVNFFQNSTHFSSNFHFYESFDGRNDRPTSNHLSHNDIPLKYCVNHGKAFLYKPCTKKVCLIWVLYNDVLYDNCNPLVVIILIILKAFC